MTPLRQRFIEDMQLRGLSEKTQRAYVLAVRQLAEYYGKSPDQISDAELRQYFLYLTNEKKVSRSGVTIALCGLKFFYEQSLNQSWPTLKLVRPAKGRKLPVVFSRAEVHQLLGCLRRLQYQACLGTIYSCGLRVGEGVKLQVNDIDSQRMLIHVRQGKGNKDRYVPLSQQTLALLRAYWVTHRHPVWLFPARSRGGQMVPDAQKPLQERSVGQAFRVALKESGIQKKVTVHTLRHSWATHLLEAGVNIRLIQTYLGHRSLTTTALYTHLTCQTETEAVAAIEQLMADLPCSS